MTMSFPFFVPSCPQSTNQTSNSWNKLNPIFDVRHFSNETIMLDYQFSSGVATASLMALANLERSLILIPSDDRSIYAV